MSISREPFLAPWQEGATFGLMASWATGRATTRDIAVRCAVLAAAYFVSAKLGLSLAYSNENITSV